MQFISRSEIYGRVSSPLGLEKEEEESLEETGVEGEQGVDGIERAADLIDNGASLPRDNDGEEELSFLI